MPVKLMVLGARDLLFREHLEGESFEADVVNKYGRTLYDIFFEPYTRKFLFYSPSELHRDWARAGVNRAVIDKRAQADSLWGLLKTTMMPKPVETMFLYPPNGVGKLSDGWPSTSWAEAGNPARAGDARHRDHRAPDHRDRNRGRAFPCEQRRLDGAADHVEQHARVTDVDLEYLSTLFFNFESEAAPARLSMDGFRRRTRSFRG